MWPGSVLNESISKGTSREPNEWPPKVTASHSMMVAKITRLQLQWWSTNHTPKDPCMVYLPTLTIPWPILFHHIVSLKLFDSKLIHPAKGFVPRCVGWRILTDLYTIAVYLCFSQRFGCTPYLYLVQVWLKRWLQPTERGRVAVSAPWKQCKHICKDSWAALVEITRFHRWLHRGGVRQLASSSSSVDCGLMVTRW